MVQHARCRYCTVHRGNGPPYSPLLTMLGGALALSRLAQGPTRLPPWPVSTTSRMTPRFQLPSFMSSSLQNDITPRQAAGRNRAGARPALAPGSLCRLGLAQPRNRIHSACCSIRARSLVRLDPVISPSLAPLW